MTLTDLFRSTQGQAPDGFRLVDQIKDATRHVDFFRKDDDLVIAFWPTIGNLYWTEGETFQHFMAEGADWLKNFAAWKKGLTVGSKTYQAHEGFVAEYLSLRGDIFRIEDIQRPARIYITGFSQGGAHATLCHRDFLHKYPLTPVSTTVFASPRVYGLSGAMEFDRRTIDKIGYDFQRVELHGDPVPKLAPWFLNYVHVGPVLRIGDPKAKIDFAKCHTPEAYLTALEGR